MSNTLSPINPETHAELAELMGGDFEAMNINEEERIIAGLVASVRGQIVAAMHQDNVGVRQLSRELGVSAAAVSRHLNAEGDMRFSTAALLAHALHRHWSVNLVPDRPAVASTSNYYGSAFSQHAANLMFSANVGPTITGSTSTVGMIDRDRAIEPLGVLTY
jgi:Trp operon repressor